MKPGARGSVLASAVAVGSLMLFDCGGETIDRGTRGGEHDGGLGGAEGREGGEGDEGRGGEGGGAATADTGSTAGRPATDARPRGSCAPPECECNEHIDWLECRDRIECRDPPGTHGEIVPCRCDGGADGRNVCDLGVWSDCQCPGPVPCGDDLECSSGTICMRAEELAGALGFVTWECWPDPCPGAPDKCECLNREGGVACPFGCGQDTSLTDGGVIEHWYCTFGGVCAAGDTPVATPEGERPISDLRLGDDVYTLDRGELAIRPVVARRRASVSGHTFVRIELASGRELRMSGPHPTRDGRSFASLEPGDRIDGIAVTAVTRVPNGAGRAYDILPASDSGVYFAGGVAVGSTLARSAVARSR